MAQYVLHEDDLTMNPITGKPCIGRDLNKYFNNTKREHMNQIERTNQKFYNKLRDYISTEGIQNGKVLSNKYIRNLRSVSSNSALTMHHRNLSSDQKDLVVPGRLSTTLLSDCIDVCTNFGCRHKELLLHLFHPFFTE